MKLPGTGAILSSIQLKSVEPSRRQQGAAGNTEGKTGAIRSP
jgi:hypothetical protein